MALRAATVDAQAVAADARPGQLGRVDADDEAERQADDRDDEEADDAEQAARDDAHGSGRPGRRAAAPARRT